MSHTYGMSSRLRSLPPNVIIGSVLLGIIVVITVASPWIAPFDPTKMDINTRLSPPSATHIFGTDEFGRDLFSRVITGGRLSLGIGVIAVASGLFVGVILGMVAAFSGNVLRTLLLRVFDMMYSFPDILLALALVAFLGPNVQNATIAIALSLVPFYAKVAYGLAAAEKAKPYVEAAYLAGISQTRILRVQVLPNILQSFIVLGTLGFSSAILAVAGLSFLGLGAQPPSTEWGVILASGRNYITKAPWILIFPGAAICLTVLAFNLLGDSVRDITDPKTTGRQ